MPGATVSVLGLVSPASVYCDWVILQALVGPVPVYYDSIGYIASLICNFHVSMAAHTVVSADSSLRYCIACCFDVKQAISK